MSEKDSFWDNPFGGFFDINGDGKEDLGEQWLAYMMFEDITKADDDDSDPIFEDDLYHSWRLFCQDGSQYGINPENYETEVEYLEALDSARSIGAEYSPMTVATDDSEDEDDLVKESDYPNKRQYMAAAALAEHHVIYLDKEKERKDKNRCRFILEQSHKVIAANYLTADGDFLFSQAIKDHFQLPITLPDEDETSEISLGDILQKLQKKDVALTLKVWEWCMEQFLPYGDYTFYGREAMTNGLLDELDGFPDKFRKAFREHLNQHADFRAKLVREADEMPDSLGELIVNMIRDGYTEAAKAMFDDGLYRSQGKWKLVNQLMWNVIFYAMDGEEIETIEFVEQAILTKLQQFSDVKILDKIQGWQQKIAEYKQEIELEHE